MGTKSYIGCSNSSGVAVKALFAILIISLIQPSFAVADICVKHKSHTDGYYYGGRVYPEEDREAEVWIGDKKISYIHQHRTVILDLNENLLTFVNRDDSTYAETALPLEWMNLVPEQLILTLRRYQTYGVVRQTGETRVINGRNCKGYEVNSWLLIEGGRYNERDAEIWVATDVPFDLETFEEMEVHVLKLQNNSDEFLKELGKIEGYEVASDTDIYIKGFSIRSTDEVVGMFEREAPAGIYSAPAGFVKKEKLSMRDLRGR